MKGVYVAGGGIIALIVIGVAAALLIGVSGPEMTFYVVAYHWGFAVYDENGNELDKISVEKGTKITLMAINIGAVEENRVTLPEPIHSAVMGINFHERAEGDNLFTPPENQTIGELIEEAHMQGLVDHGIAVSGFSMNIPLMMDATGISHVTFTADRNGDFNFVCTVNCGYGHAYMVMKKLAVT